MKKIFFVVVVAFVASLGWHMKVARDLETSVDALVADIARGEWEMTSSINPFTSVVKVHVRVATDELDDWAGLKASVLKTVAEKFASAMIEEEFARIARERRDVYAMLVPYQVRTTVGY